MIPRSDEVLAATVEALIFSIFDLFAELTAFCTQNGLNEWLRMPQGAASVPACFGCVMLLVTAALDTIQMSLKDAIGSDDSPINYVATLAASLARLRTNRSFLRIKLDRSRANPTPGPRHLSRWCPSSR